MADGAQGKTMTECFGIFDVVTALTTTDKAISFATLEVIRDFANDGWCYLELRSTPKDCAATGMTKASSVDLI